MTNNTPNGLRAAGNNTPATTGEDFISYKNRITTSVLNKIAALQKGGITVPKGFSADNQIYLAFLKLSSMEDPKTHQPILQTVTPQSVANALLTMCLKGLSMEKGQCTFIRYGRELQFQQMYHGTVALAKRYGADDPQAQVIYEGDEFEYEINPQTGKKRVIRHVQRLENIKGDKIVGAWCLIPYAGHPEKDPKVEVMTMDEIRRSWMQGATRGERRAHRNFPQEMAKKTVIGRACKLFVSTSDDSGVYGDPEEVPEWQEGAEALPNAREAVFEELPSAAPESVPAEPGTQAAEPAPEPDPDPAPAPDPAPEEKTRNADFFNA